MLIRFSVLLWSFTSPLDSAFIGTEPLMVLETEGSFFTDTTVEVAVGKEEFHFLFHKLGSLFQRLCPPMEPCLSITSSHEGFKEEPTDGLPTQTGSLTHIGCSQSLLQHDSSYETVLVTDSLAFNKSFSVHRKVFLLLNVGVIFSDRTRLLSWSTDNPKNWAAFFVSKSSCIFISLGDITVIQYYRLSYRQC